MATRQGIDTKVLTALTEDRTFPFFAIKAQFDTETVRLWTGKDDISISSETYLGAGTALSFSGVDETQELKSNGITVTLSGMDETVLNLALSEQYQNRKIEIFLGFLDGGTNEVKGTMVLFSGRMLQMSVNDNIEGMTVAVSAESRLVDLERPSQLRYNRGSQQFIDSADTAFKFVQSNLEKEIFWGRESTVPTAPSVGGGIYGVPSIGVLGTIPTGF